MISSVELKERKFNKAKKELLRKDPNLELAIKLMEESKELGFSKAYYAIATWYLHGSNGYKKNWTKGINYLKIASKDNVTEALFDLAVSYETGRGIKKSKKKAFEFYLKAALKGDLDSMVAMGRCYFHGIGVKKNKSIGNIWLDKAEELGAKW